MGFAAAAGPLLGAMLAVALHNVLTDRAPDVRAGFRVAGRVLVGATVGSLASATLLATVGRSIAWILVLSLAVVVLALAVSAAAGAVALWWTLPGGVIVWALAAAAALHVIVPGVVALPSAFRTAAQILIGVAIGATVTRRPLRALHAVRWPLAVCTALLLSVSVAAGLLLAHRTPLDAATALFAIAPGGANDMAVASLYFGVDAALVAACQVVRQLLVFVVVPLVFAVVPHGPSPGGG